MAMVKEYQEHCALKDAISLLLSSFNPLDTVKMPVQEALNHSIAEDILSKRNVPHYTASAVDGYALSSEKTVNATPATPRTLLAGEYIWVNTGSAVPDSADAVVMVEDTSLDGTQLTVRKMLTPGANVRAVGEDVMVGQLLAHKGEVLTPPLVPLLLCSGVDMVSVFKRPAVLFIPTGDEIVPVENWFSGVSPEAGTVLESNSALIKATLSQWGFDLVVHSIVPDNPVQLAEAISLATDHYDVVLVGAGSAKGKRDHTASVFSELGSLLFRWVLSKPGRPAMAASIKNKPVVCLPGFSMSTAVVLWSLVHPLLQKISGGEVHPYPDSIAEAVGAMGILNAGLLLPHSSPAGIEEWLRVQVAQVDREIYCWPLASGASVLWALARADGIVLLPAKSLECDKGTKVNVWMTKSVNLDRRILFQGSDDPAIQLLISYMHRLGCDMVIRSVGSMGGLSALSRNEGHVAAIHLLDPESGSYNDSYIRSFSGKQQWSRKLVFLRQQGFLLAPGNPKKIHSLKDIMTTGSIFVNRQPGAGTRVLFDYMLKQSDLAPSEITGYSFQCVTHLEAANRVATGLADVALGVKSAADAMGLDFIPLAEEPYELVIPEQYGLHPGVLALFESLQNENWRRKVELMGGYRWMN